MNAPAPPTRAPAIDWPHAVAPVFMVMSKAARVFRWLEAIEVPPANEPTAGGPDRDVVLRNAAFRSALIAAAVVVSGYTFVSTVPLMAGGTPAQRPTPPALSTIAALHVCSGVNTTLPLMWVVGKSSCW